MKTRNLLMAVALPTLFAACSQDEALVNVTPETQYKGVPLENVTLSFNKEEGAETRMTNDGWNLKWGAGDEVGLVWVNAPEILNQFNRGETYDPTVLPGTAFWASNTRMTCSDPANSIFKMQDGQVLEGTSFLVLFHQSGENVQRRSLYGRRFPRVRQGNEGASRGTARRALSGMRAYSHDRRKPFAQSRQFGVRGRVRGAQATFFPRSETRGEDPRKIKSAAAGEKRRNCFF